MPMQTYQSDTFFAFPQEHVIISWPTYHSLGPSTTTRDLQSRKSGLVGLARSAVREKKSKIAAAYPEMKHQ
jgi:hypothetical protein